MLFNVLADVTEENAELGAKAIQVAQRTHNGVLDAIGVNKFLPTPVKDLTDQAFQLPQNIVLGTGHTSANVLRKIE